MFVIGPKHDHSFILSSMLYEMQWKVSQYLRQAPAYIYIDVKADMVCTQVSWLLHAPFHNPFHIKASMAIYY